MDAGIQFPYSIHYFCILFYSFTFTYALIFISKTLKTQSFSPIAPIAMDTRLLESIIARIANGKSLMDLIFLIFPFQFLY